MWFERAFQFRMGPHLLRGRVDRVDRLPGRRLRADRLQDRPPEDRAQLREDVQLSLYAVGARESWELEAASQAYYYVLDDEKVPVERGDADRDWITETVMTVAEGIQSQGFEPTPVMVGVLDVRLPDRLPGGRALALVAALAQEALELAREHVAGRERARVGAAGLLVRGALQALHEGLHVGVELDGAGHLRLVLGRRVLEVRGVHGHADEGFEAPEQRERALRVRRDRDVVRHGRPQRGRGQAGVGERVVQDADDPGRALVGRRRQREPLDQARDRTRAR